MKPLLIRTCARIVLSDGSSRNIRSFLSSVSSTAKCQLLIAPNGKGNGNAYAYAYGHDPGYGQKTKADLLRTDSIPFSTYSRHYSQRQLVLGIETSCDDTGAAVVDEQGNVIGEALNSQTRIHVEYASRSVVGARS